MVRNDGSKPLAPDKSAEIMEQIIWLIPRIYHRLTGATERLYRLHI